MSGAGRESRVSGPPAVTTGEAIDPTRSSISRPLDALSRSVATRDMAESKPSEAALVAGAVTTDAVT